MIGTTVAHYRIIERLGGGGMGVVYRALDLNLDRPVAVKFLAPFAASDPEARARLLGEARASAAISHPNVCMLREIGETDDGDLYLVMDYCAGRSLRDILRAGPLPAREAALVCLAAARALEAAHARGVVHRDIKPANLMVAEDGTVRVVDFGLARFADASALSRTGAAAGTAGYMAPEQIQAGHVDYRTDLWALGIVLYECLAGAAPFGGTTEGAVLAGVMRGEPRPLAAERPGVPAALAAIVERALQKDPARRWQSAAEMAAALESALREIDAGIARPARLPLVRITRKTARIAMLVGAGLVLAAGAAYGFRSLLARRGPPVVLVESFVAAGQTLADEKIAAAFRDNLISDLTRLGRVRVLVAPDPSVRFRIEGSLQTANGVLEPFLNLVDARTSEILWSAPSDALPLAQESTIRGQVVAEIARRSIAAAKTVSGIGFTVTQYTSIDPKVRSHEEAASAALDLFTASGALKAMTEARSARDVVPPDGHGHGLAWSARMHILAASEWYGPLMPLDSLAALEEARNAAQRFPREAIPVWALEEATWRVTGDLGNATILLDQVAAVIGMSYDFDCDAAYLALARGDPARAINEIENAIRMYPLGSRLLFTRILAYLVSGKRDVAEKDLADFRKFKAASPACDYLEGLVAGTAGEYATAARAFRRAANGAGNPPTAVGMLAWALARAGDTAGARAVEATLPLAATIAYPHALAALGAGNEARALDLLQEAARQGDGRASEALYMPVWASLMKNGAAFAALQEGWRAQAAAATR